MSTFRRKDARVPLAYLLCGVIMGISLARFIHWPAIPILCLAMIFGLMALLWAWTDQHQKLWPLVFITAATLGFYGYQLERRPPTPSESQLRRPARETVLRIEIEHLYAPDTLYGTVRGAGKVKDAPVLSRMEQDMQIYFACPAHARPITPLQEGQIIEARGILVPIPEAAASREVFYKYLQKSHIYYRFERIQALEIIRPASAWEHRIQGAKQRMEQILVAGAPKERPLHRIYTAMLLGQRDTLSESQNTRFERSGTMHFFAISGLHIGVIAAVIAQILFLLRVPRGLSPLIGLGLLLAYVLVTGASPSAIRAYLMAACFWTAYALNRQRAPIPALIASAVCVLIVDPDQLWQIGFQLSYLVVLSILLLGIPLYEYLKDRCIPFKYIPATDLSWQQHALRFCWDKALLLLVVSGSAWFASAPITAVHFGYLAPYAICLNMLLVNLIALIICIGVLSLITGLSGLLFLSTFINHGAWLLLDLTNQLVETNLHLPYSTIDTPDLPHMLSYLWSACLMIGLIALHNKRNQKNKIGP